MTTDLRRARNAVVVAFAVNGLAFASFISRTPAIADGLGLTTAQLALMLLCLSAGSVAGLPLAGPLVARLGPGRSVLVAALTETVGLALLALGLLTASVLPAAIGLAVTGLGTGVWDVAMNVAGAEVEQRRGRTLMPRLHAAFSIGTVVGAGIGAATAATGVPLAAQVLGVVVLIPLVMTVAVRGFLPSVPAPTRAEGGTGVLAAWREPRTLLIGVLVLGFAFTEGSANDWIAYALVEGYGASETVGAIAFGVFVSAMTVGRTFGGSALERYGRVAVLRAAAGLALVGLLLVLVGGSVPVALAGALLWGLGASLGFPVGMSAAADDPAKAAARVSVVSSVGYTAFLAGPPLIGLLAQDAGILTALFVVLGALVVGLLATGAARPTAGAAPVEPARR
ncbi:MFS transporter [Pseudonocardia hydrocarbonoxydans]|uniref:MFS transporter n=1 Tax=Pseudonocardia hydrocarbonoxydans TaxID=76726 RepID=A0A4Y3WPB5_9PSEU|nr:MFS transporter [Pseudonocardia hydrocarbonoxydans]GEC19900.1 MFS transporter [Pseudonocardia hydrocarbonoxydans]